MNIDMNVYRAMATTTNDNATKNDTMINQEQASQTTQNNSSTTIVAPVQEVELTPQAKQLQSLELEISDLPEVDVDKVNAIKNLIASGEYKIDDEKIASNLIHLESELGNIK